METKPRATHGLARILSKLGVCSRSEAEAAVRAGRVSVGGQIVLDPETRTDSGAAIILDGQPVSAARPVYLMLNKPRGLVTTRSDPEGRPTVYACLEGLDLPHVAPVGRLDKASEGLLLMTNDTVWANAILDGPRAPAKTYHVKIDRPADETLLAALLAGIEDRGEHLSAKSARSLREGVRNLLKEGTRNAWLEIVLDEGRNRQIRRLLAAFGIETLRLVRVSIGQLTLGDLAKGTVRPLTPDEIAALRV